MPQIVVTRDIMRRCAAAFPSGATFCKQWRWLYAPSPQAVEFALRNTIAALVALAIAVWMELDSPVWAPSTVWAVAQASRGESLSKARWRLAGTFFGGVASVALIAAFPQEPWLFFPALALWVGGCAGLSTFFSSYRAYAMTLAGYTCAIIALDASMSPDDVFFIAVSRSTYIGLGVVCEALMGMIFSFGQERRARRAIRTSLQRILEAVLQRASDVLGKRTSRAAEGRALFTQILRLNNEIEYSEIEMGPHGHEGDHARADLAAVAIVLTRCMGMTARLKALRLDDAALDDTLKRIRTFIQSIPRRLELDTALHEIMADLHLLRLSCRQGVIDRVYPQPPPTHEHHEGLGSTESRVLYVSLFEMLREIEDALLEYNASTHEIPHDRFRFRLPIHRDIREAAHNALRVIVAVLSCALFYEVTAWPSGPLFISNVALICGLYATQENAVLGTTSFFRGAVWSVAVASVLTLLLLPAVSSYEMLILIVAPPMFISGLARMEPRTMGSSAAFGLLMPTMLNIQNHVRLDEISFLNASLAILSASGVAVLTFKIVMPFDPQAERLRLRQQVLSQLRSLCISTTSTTTTTWISENLDRFAKLIRHAGSSPPPEVEAYLRGTLATLTLGMNIVRLRRLLSRDHLPESARRPAALLLHRIAFTHRTHDRPARVAAAAIRRFSQLEERETDLMTRLELIRGIAYLVVIANELTENAQFLDANDLTELT